MTSIRMAISELRRITAGRLPMLAVIALCLVPVLYGGLYLYANHDPYGKLDAVPAALVVADTGVRQDDGSTRNVGEDVATTLVDGHAFDWHRVDEQEAAAGVREGRYTFSLTVPADFTAALTSSSDFQPRQAMLVLTTNDANGYLVRTIAGTLTSRIHDSVAAQVGEEAADRFLTGFAQVHDKLSEAADGAGRLADGANQAHDGAGQLATGAGQLVDGERKLVDGSGQLSTGATQLADGARKLDDGAGKLADGLDQLHDGTRTLPADSKKLADGAQQVADGNKKIADAGAAAAGVSQDLADQLDAADGDLRSRLLGLGITGDQADEVLGRLTPLRQKLLAGNDKLQQVNGQLTQLADGSQQVADGARKLADAAPQLADGIAQADDGAHQLKDGSGQLATGADTLATGANDLKTGQQTALDGSVALHDGAVKLGDGTGQLSDGATQLHDGLQSGLGDVPNPDDATRQATARTIGDPLAVQNVAQNEAADYGAGLAPFFMTLATWIGAYVLFLLLKPLSTRALAANQTPLRVALGGWLPAALLGVVQTTALYAVIVFGLGMHPEHPVLALLLMWLAAACFTAIIHALNAVLGSVGQFLGLVLMVLQLVSSGGTFPWQTIPDVLYPVHYLLPMSYVIDGLRQLVYGGELGIVAADVGVVVAWLVVALLVSARAARTMRVWTATRVKPELVL